MHMSGRIAQQAEAAHDRSDTAECTQFVAWDVHAATIAVAEAGRDPVQF